MKQEDIVWVRMPSSGLEGQRARPAPVISRDAHNQAHDAVVVCAITSNLKSGDCKVGITEKDLDAGNLPLPSMVRADKVLQIEKNSSTEPSRESKATYDEVVKRLHALVRRQKATAR